jgi:TolB-like protein/Flp pilus assembly protein TadD
MADSPERWSEIDALFDQALRLTPEERGAFLEKACKGNRELRRQVERLLRAAEVDDSFLEEGGGLEGPMLEDLRQEASSDLSGSKLKHYDVLSRLGAGGMGEVYLAEDTELKREVALKVLPGDVAGDAERLRRFKQEARALATLNHPNIVTIHSVEEEDGTPFLTMELVQGPRLDEIIPEGGLDLERLLEIALQLTQGLGAAHQRRVTHRDLKAQNVMLTPDGRVKILDFGLAKLKRAEPLRLGDTTKLATLTREGEIVGTIAYMSPEQLQGRDVDERSDVFSLGVLLFEMATGRRPFEGEDSASVISAILRDAPPALTQIRSDLPPPLADLVHGCLEKDPAKRYANAEVVQQELATLVPRIEAGNGSQAAVAPAAGRLESWGRGLLIAAGVIGLIAIGVFLSMRLGDRPAGPADEPPTAQAAPTIQTTIAVLPFENLGDPEDDYFATGMTEEINGRLAALSGLGVLARQSVEKAATGDKTAQEIGRELGSSYLLDGSVRWQREADGPSRVRITQQLIRVEDGLHVWAQIFDRSLEDLFAIQAEIAEQVTNELGVRILETEEGGLRTPGTDNLEAYEAFLRGRHEIGRSGPSADEKAEAALPFFERAVELDPEFLAAWRALANVHGVLYGFGFDRTEARLEKARDAVERMREIDPDSPLTHRAASKFYQRTLRDYGKAYEELALAEESLPNHPGIQRDLAIILRRRGLWEEANVRLERAMRLDPLDATKPATLGYNKMCLRRFPEALSYLDTALAMDPDLFWERRNKSMALLLWKGDTHGARAALEPIAEQPGALHERFWLEVYDGRYPAALALLEAAKGRWVGRPTYFRPPALLAGFIHHLQAQPEAAESAYDEARRQLETELEKSPEHEKMLSALAVAYAGLGRKEEAVDTAIRATELVPLAREPYFGSTHVEDLAWVHTLVGELDAALDQLETLLSMPSELSVALLELDPRWAPLHDHPRYRELKVAYGTPADS